MAMATNSISGILSGCSNTGRIIGALIRNVQRLSFIVTQTIKRLINPFKTRHEIKYKKWKSIGVGTSLLLKFNSQQPEGMKQLNKEDLENDNILMTSYFDVFNNETLLGQIIRCNDTSSQECYGLRHFVQWVQSKPS